MLQPVAFCFSSTIRCCRRRTGWIDDHVLDPLSSIGGSAHISRAESDEEVEKDVFIPFNTGRSADMSRARENGLLIERML